MAATARRRWFAATIAVAVVVAAGAALYWRFLRAVPAAVVVVGEGRVPAFVVGPATVQSRVPLTVSARVTSTVTAVAVDVGDPVRAGQLLVTLDDRDLVARRAAVASQQASLARQVEAAQASVARAQADLTLAQVKRGRDAQLRRQGFVSQAVLDASEAALQSAQAALDSAQATLAARQADQVTLVQEARVADAQVGFARLVAPMSGMVTQRLVEPGTTVAPGTPILRLVDPAALWVATRVDESVVARVRPGQPASIRLRSGEALTGTVARVALQSDAATRELDVHVAFDSPPSRFAIDQEAEVRIAVGHDEGLLVPLQALVRDRDGRQGVLAVREGRARFAPVSTGTSHDGLVLVREGLRAGDSVITQARTARDGMRVAPQPAAR